MSARRRKDKAMTAPVIDDRFHKANLIADLNRKAFRDADIVAVSVLGGPGCGKTTLIDATIQRLMPEVRVGVIACDVASHLDADRLTRHSDQVVQVNVGAGGLLDATYIRDALESLDLKKIDVLFIENIGTLVGGPLDLGQEVTVAIFSVAAGHDKAAKHPELVRAATGVVLNKTDLLTAVPFDPAVFRADVQRLKQSARLFELSALTGNGMDQWVKWLRRPVNVEGPEASRWFG
jgi:hydrogenase nickel incorporation protein HypB